MIIGEYGPRASVYKSIKVQDNEQIGRTREEFGYLIMLAEKKSLK
jgi:hypothetical protein